MIKFYGYEKCSTCRKAQSLLIRKKRAHEAIDITRKPPLMKELKAMLSHLNGDIRKLFNTSGQVYREMKLGDKLKNISEAEALKLLASNGRLVKRPFLMIDDKPAAVGFNEDEWSKLV